MTRLLPIALLCSAPALAKDPAPPLACGAMVEGELVLGSDEFGVEYRPAEGVMALDLPSAVPASPRHAKARISGGLRTVPVALGQTATLLAAHREQMLQARLGVVEVAGPLADSACTALSVTRITLQIGDVLMASSHAAPRPPPGQHLRTRVKVGALVVEDGGPAVSDAFLRERLRFRAEACLRREAAGRPVRGSVVLEIKSRMAGTVLRPTAPVDGLDHPALVFCLINAVYDDADVAQSLPSGAHFYAPFYFRPDDSKRLLIDSKAP